MAANLQHYRISSDDARRDIVVMLWSMRLQSIRRYFHQRFWEHETRAAEFAARVETAPRLESVAEHSWHVADTILLLGGHFPGLNVERCVTLAVLHDKMEIVTGDKNPVGRSGTGFDTHAFNQIFRLHKDPGLATHYSELRTRLLRQVAKRRSISIQDLEGQLQQKQLSLPI